MGQAGEGESGRELRASPGKQTWKPGAQAQLSPNTALPATTGSSPIISELVQQLSFDRFGRQNSERGSSLLKVTQQVGSRSDSQTQASAFLVGATVGSLSPRATCKPVLLISESRMIPGPEVPGLGIGFRELYWCCSLRLGWPGCLVSPVAAVALTSRMAPRTGQSIRSRMTWRAGAGPFYGRQCCLHSPLVAPPSPPFPTPLATSPSARYGGAA